VHLAQPRTNRRTAGAAYITVSSPMLNPSEARQLAALLLQAADMVEGGTRPARTPEGVRDRHTLLVIQGGAR
jgi:hypothetical protein